MTPFELLLNHVRQSPEWWAMVRTVENTGWHREENVAIHTMMCLEHYDDTFAKDRSPRSQMLSKTALLFHDFGKPPTERFIDGRNRYQGHEPVSGDMFMEFLVKNDRVLTSLLQSGALSFQDIVAVKFLVDEHLPYAMKNVHKVQKLKDDIKHHLGEDEEAFYDVLRSDCWGRISDDHDVKKQNVEDWINEFRAPPVVPAGPKLTREERKTNWLAKNAPPPNIDFEAFSKWMATHQFKAVTQADYASLIAEATKVGK